MTIVFLTNFINHHQVHFADALAATEGVDYHLIQTMPMPDSFKNNGYPDYSTRPYIINAYESDQEMARARKLIDDADVAILGDAPREWGVKRIEENKVTFNNEERWFRRFHIFSHRAVRNWWHYHTRFRNKPLYMLCMGAFVPYDVSRIFAYPHKTYRWGYLTKVPEFDIESSLVEKRESKKFRLLYVSRMLKLKHPDMMVGLANYLRGKGYDFEINMYGKGEEMEEKMHALISENNLGDYVHMLGVLPNDRILDEMRKHHAFLFTSDKEEGWGAVVNEAMANGCTVVGGNRIGSVPFLIEPHKTGLIFKDRNQKSLNQCAEYLLTHRDECEQMALNGYKLLRDVWSPANGAKNFIRLAKSALAGKIDPPEYGPGSIAPIIKG